MDDCHYLPFSRVTAAPSGPAGPSGRWGKAPGLRAPTLKSQADMTYAASVGLLPLLFQLIQLGLLGEPGPLGHMS